MDSLSNFHTSKKEGMTKNHAAESWYSKYRKYFITIFIILCLLLQLKANLRFGYFYPDTKSHSPFFHRISADSNASEKVSHFIDEVDWVVTQVSGSFGLATSWRVFSKPEKDISYLAIWANFPDGRAEWIEVPTQKKRNFWERNFLDFREAHFHARISEDPQAMNDYTQYLCERLRRLSDTPDFMRFVMVRRPILSPEKTYSKIDYYGPKQDLGLGLYYCGIEREYVGES